MWRLFDIFEFGYLFPFSFLSSFIGSIAASFTSVYDQTCLALKDHNQMFIP